MFVKISEQPSLYNDLEKKSVREILEDINREDQKVALAVQKAIPQIEKLVTQIVPRMKQGGRIFYMGAGTSGRLGRCSASVLPVYSKFFVETHGKGSIPNCPPYIRDKFWFYQENRNISQETVVDIMARINKWIDTGISIELMYNLNRNIRAKDIYNTIMSAWKKDIKTLYYTRTIQKDGSSLEKTECVSCAG